MDSIRLQTTAKKLFIEQSQRHVFLCIGESCCSKADGEAAWEALKKELKDRNLSLSDSEASCYRTKVGCLRVCSDGPILVVYPEGHWYAEMTADKIPEFVDKQIVHGEAIPAWIFASNSLKKRD